MFSWFKKKEKKEEAHWCYKDDINYDRYLMMKFENQEKEINEIYNKYGNTYRYLSQKEVNHIYKNKLNDNEVKAYILARELSIDRFKDFLDDFTISQQVEIISIMKGDWNDN